MTVPFANIVADVGAPLFEGGVSAKRTCYQVWSSSIITALANFGVLYNYNSIAGLSSSWLTALYGDPVWANQLSSNVIFVGTLIGMLGFGVLGDLIGLDRAMTLTLAVQAVGALMQAVMPWGSPDTAWSLLIVARFIIGVGCGGVYPLSAGKAAADATHTVDPDEKAKSAAIAFFWRNPAMVWIYLFGYLLYLGPGAGIPSSVDGQLEPEDDAQRRGWQIAWRVALGFGCIAPALMTVASVFEPRASGALRDVNQPPLLERVIKARPWRGFIATGGTWFFFDISYYGNSLLQPKILDTLAPPNATLTVWESEAENMAVAMVGVLFTLVIILLLPVIGVIRMQHFGLLLVTIIATILAFTWGLFQDAGVGAPVLLPLYALLYGSYWAPNVTTYIMATIAFEPSIRSTMNGMSAALGKVGAILGSSLFKALLEYEVGGSENAAVQIIMALCAAFGACGIVCTYVGVGHGCKPKDLPSEYQSAAVAPLVL